MIAYQKHDSVLRLENVGLTLGNRQILRDISVDVQNITREDCCVGQIICALGPSGIGKTQLARIIAGLNPPTTGLALLSNGRKVQKGLVGMVPQDYPLFEFATVAENFRIAGGQVGLSAKQVQEKSAAYVQEFGLTNYLGIYPAQLSGGTRQRVAIVRQLMSSEHYLVMDEPFSGLDLIMKRRACELIQRVANLDDLNTIMVNTHDVTEGMSIADTVWLMGLERGPSGEFIPGARILEQYDLAAMGLAWRPDIAADPDFQRLVQVVKARFHELVP